LQAICKKKLENLKVTSLDKRDERVIVILENFPQISLEGEKVPSINLMYFSEFKSFIDLNL
jgi:hypothetical protein